MNEIPEILTMDMVYAYLMAKYRRRHIEIDSDSKLMMEVSEAIYDNSEYGINPNTPVTDYKYTETTRKRYYGENGKMKEVGQDSWADFQVQHETFIFNDAYWNVRFSKHNADSFMKCDVDITRDKCMYDLWVSIIKGADKKSKDVTLWW